MPDNSLDIYIRLITQQTGEKPEVVLKKLKEEITSTGKETVKQAEQMAEANKKWENSQIKANLAIKDTGEQVSKVANKIGFALNPQLIGVGLLLKTFQLLNEQIAKTNELLEPSKWEGRAAAIQAAGKAIEDSAIAANRYWHDLNRAASETDTLASAAAAAKDSIHGQASAETEIVNAKEKAGLLDKAAADKARSAIKEKEQAEALNILLTERARLAEMVASKEKALPEMQRAAAGATASNVEMAKERQLLAGNIASSEAKIAAYQDELEKRDKFGMRSSIYDKLTDKDVRGSLQSEIAARDAAKTILDRFNRNRVGTESANNNIISDAAAAQADLSASRRRVGALDSQITSTRERNGLNSMTQARVDAIQSGQGPQADMLLNAAAGADAIRGGGRATADQARAINQAAAALGLQGQNTAMILNILGRLNDDVKALNSGLKTLESRVNNNNTRV